MAEVLTQKLGIPPTGDAVPVQQIENTPVRSMLTPAQEFDTAVDSGDPKLMLKVAQVNADTPVGVAATAVADLFYKGQKAVDEMMAPIEKAGGLQTPEGRMQVAKQAQTYFKQEDPKFFDAFIHAITGNKKMAQNLLTGGDVKYLTKIDENGRSYQVGFNGLGKIIDVEDMQKRKVSREEFDALKIGRQSSFENTLTYLQSKQINESNTAEWQAKQKRDANAETTYNGVIAPLAARMYDDLEFVKNLDLDPKQRAEMFRFANTAIGASSSRSQGEQTLQQMQSNLSAKIGKNVSDADIKSLGLPAGIYQYTDKGIYNKDANESISFAELGQKQSTANKSSEIDTKYSQTKQDFAKYLQTTGLPKEQQDRVLRIFDASKEIGKSLLKLESEGAPRFLFTPNASDAEDPYGLIQGKNIQLLTNQQLLKMNSEYNRGVLQAAQRKGGIMPNPAEIEAGFARTPEFKQIVNQGMAMTNETMKRYSQAPTRQVQVTSPIAPTEAIVSGGVGLAPPTADIGSVGAERVGQFVRDAQARGAPVMNEIPAGFEDTGKVNNAGQKLIRRPGGKDVYVLDDVINQLKGR